MTFFAPRTVFSALAVSALALTLFAHSAAAETIKYLSDPVYEKLAAEDPHPMEDLLLMGEEGDARAQFILGDLYGKGKGGLPRNIKKARGWFEQSARGGYAQSFIRLAALEKRVKKPEDAYKWYTLAIEALPSAERKWAQTSRDALVKEHSLTPAQTKAAKAAASAWKKAAAEAADAAKKKAAEDKRAADKKGEKKTDASAPSAIEPAAGEATPETAGKAAPETTGETSPETVVEAAPENAGEAAAAQAIEDIAAAEEGTPAEETEAPAAAESENETAPAAP
ncbi:MAG TPA: hypothetical protein PLX33_09265 [Alphaproteobacteria bacterium]|nr:hypothetical protein [Alphaproteobacteria bacterium]